MAELRFLIEGEGADAGAAAFERALAGLGDDVAARREAVAALPADERRKLDPIALAALVVAIPSAALAVWDLADRIRKRRRAEAVLAEAERLRTETHITITVIAPEGPLRLADLTLDRLLAPAAAAKDKRPE